MYDYLHTFYYNGHFLHELGAVITQPPTLITPKRDIEFFSIPGKSGDSVIDNARFENKTFRLPIRAVPTFCDLPLQDFKYKLSDWLQAGDCSYKEYRDTYNPGYYRKGIVTEIEETVAVKRDVYETTITFNFDPFLYSREGLTEIAVNSNNYTIYNRENWSSEPIIKLNGNGLFTVSINAESFNITLDGTQITVDKPNENVYYTTTKVDCNDKYSANIIPELKPGVNTIAVETENGTNFSMSIIPNWRRL